MVMDFRANSCADRAAATSISPPHILSDREYRRLLTDADFSLEIYRRLLFHENLTRHPLYDCTGQLGSARALQQVWKDVCFLLDEKTDLSTSVLRRAAMTEARAFLSEKYYRLEQRKRTLIKDISEIAWTHADYTYEQIHEKSQALIKEHSKNPENLIKILKKSPPDSGPSLKWVRSTLRKQIQKAREAVHLLFQDVAKNREQYISNESLHARKRQLKAHSDWLAKTIITDSDGNSFTLDKIAPNDQKRLAEALCFIDGLDKLGEEESLDRLFVTLTLPPVYHPSPENGHSTWAGHSPGAGNNELNRQWRRFRAALAKHHLKIRFMRTTEPHCDSTPHWHIMMWTPEPEMVRDLLKKYFWHSKNSLEVKHFYYNSGSGDNSKCKASSYMLKYLAKSLFSGDRKFDQEGIADRVDAWRSIYGIRSIQFGGLAKGAISGWRETRRALVIPNIYVPEKAIPIVDSASSNNFFNFLKNWTSQSVSLLKKTKNVDDQTGEFITCRPKTIGIQSKYCDWKMITRTAHFRVSHTSSHVSTVIEPESEQVTVTLSYPSKSTQKPSINPYRASKVRDRVKEGRYKAHNTGRGYRDSETERVNLAKQMRAGGESYRKIARFLNISVSTAHTWATS